MINFFDLKLTFSIFFLFFFFIDLSLYRQQRPLVTVNTYNIYVYIGIVLYTLY